MGKPQQPARSVVDSVAAACTKVLRSVKLLGDEIPPGVAWHTKDPRKAYKFGNELGHGNYGVVHVVTHIQSGRVHACKILRKDSAGQQRHFVLAEVTALQRVSSHLNVAALHEVWEDSGYIYLIMEACLGGELFDVIIQRGHFSERDAAVVMRVILEVISFCHLKGLVHRDLKPENFLLKRQALDASLPLRAEDLRAVDFGLAVPLQPGQSLKELLGSPFYIAPELLRGSYGFPADVWSAGVILYILLSGAPPFGGRSEREVFRRILRQPLDLDSDPWPSVSAGAKDLISKLLERDPQKRLSPQQALNHEWLASAAATADTSQSDVVLARLQEFAHTSKLQGILMNLIARNLSVDGIETLRDAFNGMDTNGDGHLSFEELRRGLADASLGSEQCDKVAEAVMEALDVSRDGSIDYHEFLAAVVDRQQTLTDQMLAEMFAHLDKNKDGRINAQELSDALAESDINIPQQELRQLMSAHPGFTSRQGPGSEPMLSEQNFTDLLRGGLKSDTIQLSQLEGALSGMQQSFRVHNRFRQLAMLVIARATPVSELQGLRELFEALDVDKSGCLTVDELRRGLKKIDQELGEDEIENLLEFMDVDGSSTIDYHEFVMGVLEDKQLLTEAKLRAAFDYFDTDRNGKIDKGEVERVVKDLNIRTKISSVDLVQSADANEDEAVDFPEFRSMMLNAEPNLLINRQQSLRRRHHSGLSSAPSGGSQRTSLKAIGPAEADLAARHGAIPQEVLSDAAKRDLTSGSSASAKLAGRVAEKLPSPPETTAEDLQEEESGGKFGGLFERYRRSLTTMSNPFTGSKPSPFEGLDDTSPPRRDGSFASSLSTAQSFGRRPSGNGDLQSLRSGSRSRSWGPEQLSGASRRGRQLVFLGSTGLYPTSLSSNDSTSLEAALQRTDTAHEGAQEKENGWAAHSARQEDSPRSILPGRSSAETSSSARFGDLHETIPEHEELTAEALDTSQHHGHQRSSRGSSAELSVMLNFMEKQWSKTSVLAKSKSTLKSKH